MNSLVREPILSGKEVIGIIHLDSHFENAFLKEDENFIEILAREISISIQRALSFGEIKSLSIIDKLTNIFNRRKFDSDLEDEYIRAKRYNRNISLLMLDIDWFKNYNDSYGHIRGDSILLKIGDLLLKNSRKTDKVYRYGGEEFAIICTETNADDNFIFANRLCEIIRNENFEGAEKSQPSARITISIGCANVPESAETKMELIKKADDALYEAKYNGRDRAVKAGKLMNSQSLPSGSV